jgi:hypothetical protein
MTEQEAWEDYEAALDAAQGGESEYAVPEEVQFAGGFHGYGDDGYGDD